MRVSGLFIFLKISFGGKRSAVADRTRYTPETINPLYFRLTPFFLLRCFFSFLLQPKLPFADFEVYLNFVILRHPNRADKLRH